VGGAGPLWPAESVVNDASCREYYRKLSAGVAVVTTCGPSGWSGTTVSTVTSVSMDPPIVLCCIARGSRTLVAIQHARCFAVHLLADDQQDLADRFSQSPSDSTRFAELGYRVSLIRGAPVISGALAVGWCDLHAIHEIGDHCVVYGHLTGVRVGQGRPLLWHDRAYQVFFSQPEILETFV